MISIWHGLLWVALAATPAVSERSVRVFGEASSPVEPGASVEVRFYAELTGFTGNAAVAAFGLDVHSTGDDDAIEAIGHAAFGPLDLGTRPGEIAGVDLLRVVGGQPADVLGLFPGVDRSSTIHLFTYTIAIAPDASGRTVELTPSRPDFKGGVVVYPDADIGRSVAAPASVALTLEPLAFVVGPPCVDVDIAPPFGDADMHDLLELLRRYDAGDPRADVDGSGGVDLLDIWTFISDVARGC